MPKHACIFNESPIRLWGLTSRQRLERVLERSGITDLTENPESLPVGESVLLIHGGYLYDERVIDTLAKTNHVILRAGRPGKQAPVAASVPAELAAQVLAIIRGTSPADTSLTDIRVETPESLCSSYNQRLRKSDPPFVLPITRENQRDLEKRLFSSSYKGVTDLITKWAWPRPAQWCTRVCARYGIRPNHVTIVSLVLVIIAGILFAYGQFLWGLVPGWLMTFLDTVDGKLARVTVTSTRFGHFFDHLIDLFHPPAWYVAWGMGLGVSYVVLPKLSLDLVIWVIIIGYIAGRLIELTFKQCLGSFGIFCWQPVDSYFRLITARRNPNLILLTASAVAGRPDAGLLAVAIWTSLTSLFMLIRLGAGIMTRIVSGPLHSWLVDIDKGDYDRTLAAKVFGRRESTRPMDGHA